MKRSVLVLNHFAVPIDEPGGTRHAEIFGRLSEAWDYTLVGADREIFTGRRSRRTDSFYRSVRTTPYKGNGLGRVLNWSSYALGSLLLGIRQPQVDVVYASSPHLLAALAGYGIARIRRAGFVLEVRDLWPEVLVAMGRLGSDSFLYRLLRRLELFLYCRADEIVVLAEGSRDAIHADCPSAQNVTFVPNGSDPSMFDVDADRDRLRRDYGMTGCVLVYAGAHGPANGLGFVLDAAERVAGDLTSVSFVLVGDGPDKSRLVGEVESRGITNVRFLDPVPKSDMPFLLRASDVGLHVLADIELFHYGVSPNKLFDYMAAELPVVTNCPGEVARIVDLAGAGIAVGPRDLEAAVRRAAAAPDNELQRWGRAGRDFVEQHRSREVVASRLVEVLDRVVRDRSGPRRSFPRLGRASRPD